MSRNKKKTLDNHGSTLILVLIIVSFIAILGTVCIAAAMVNYKMKVVDKESKKAFYTSEEAIDQIYIALGKVSMSKMDESYQKVMSELTQQAATPYMIANGTANNHFRVNFTTLMASELFNGTWPTAAVPTYDQTLLVSKLNSYLENDVTTRVLSIDSVEIKTIDTALTVPAGTGIAQYQISFTNCVVEYVNTAGFYAKVTFDGIVGIPDKEVLFTEDANAINTAFEDYALISNVGIDIGQNTTVNLGAGAYAGTNGLNLDSSATLKATKPAVRPLMLVTRGDITLNDAHLSSIGATVWCSNIIEKGAGVGSTLSGDADTSFYIQDDLELDGDNSSAKIDGEYYGYSFNGSATSSGHTDSSAIIVNGKNTKVDLSNISTLVIGGRSYIDYTIAGQTDYMTGESLSLKGNQEVYLVPSFLITKGVAGAQMSNPYLHTLKDTVAITITNANFFGYSFLNATTPYTIVTNGNSDYVYLNFKSKEDISNYFKAILNDAAFTTVCGTAGADQKAYTTTRNYMQDLIRINMGYLTQSAFVNSASASQHIYTNASLIYADSSTKTVNDVTTGSSAGGFDAASFMILSKDLQIRYELTCKTLYSLDLSSTRTPYTTEPDTIQLGTGGPSVKLINKTQDIFENFINTTYFNDRMIAKSVGGGVGVDSYVIGTNKIMYATNAPTITVDNTGVFKDYEGGIIITSKAVILKKDFHGIIIAQGGITIVPNAGTLNYDNLIPGYADIDNFFAQQVDFKKYFTAWNQTVSTPTGIDSIAGITYKNLVGFKNWKKS